MSSPSYFLLWEVTKRPSKDVLTFEMTIFDYFLNPTQIDLYQFCDFKWPSFDLWTNIFVLLPISTLATNMTIKKSISDPNYNGQTSGYVSLYRLDRKRDFAFWLDPGHGKPPYLSRHLFGCDLEVSQFRHLRETQIDHTGHWPCSRERLWKHLSIYQYLQSHRNIFSSKSQWKEYYFWTVHRMAANFSKSGPKKLSINLFLKKHISIRIVQVKIMKNW